MLINWFELKLNGSDLAVLLHLVIKDSCKLPVITTNETMWSDT